MRGDALWMCEETAARRGALLIKGCHPTPPPASPTTHRALLIFSARFLPNTHPSICPSVPLSVSCQVLLRFAMSDWLMNARLLTHPSPGRPHAVFVSCKTFKQTQPNLLHRQSRKGGMRQSIAVNSQPKPTETNKAEENKWRCESLRDSITNLTVGL